MWISLGLNRFLFALADPPELFAILEDLCQDPLGNQSIDEIINILELTPRSTPQVPVRKLAQEKGQSHSSLRTEPLSRTAAHFHGSANDVVYGEVPLIYDDVRSNSRQFEVRSQASFPRPPSHPTWQALSPSVGYPSLAPVTTVSLPPRSRWRPKKPPKDVAPLEQPQMRFDNSPNPASQPPKERKLKAQISQHLTTASKNSHSAMPLADRIDQPPVVLVLPGGGQMNAAGLQQLTSWLGSLNLSSSRNQ